MPNTAHYPQPTNPPPPPELASIPQICPQPPTLKLAPSPQLAPIPNLALIPPHSSLTLPPPSTAPSNPRPPCLPTHPPFSSVYDDSPQNMCVVQATLKAYAASESLWLADQPFRVRHAYLCKCFPGTDAKLVHSALHSSKGYVHQAALVCMLLPNHICCCPVVMTAALDRYAELYGPSCPLYVLHSHWDNVS